MTVPPPDTTAVHDLGHAAATRAGRPASTDHLSIGVFYDHGWWNNVSAYYRYHSKIQARLDLTGFHDIIRWHLHRQHGTPLDRCTVTQAHYLRPSALTPTRFDSVLTDAGITLHTVPCSRPPASQVVTALAVATYDAAVHGQVDAVALLTCDPSILPLLDALDRMGIHATVPASHIYFNDEAGEQQAVDTPPELVRHATSVLPLAASLAMALDSRWPLHPPLHVSDNSPRPRPTDLTGPRRCGIVQSWLRHRGFGFLLDTQDNQWYVHRAELPEGVTTLPVGAEVEFTGDLQPDPGREYPQAHQVTIIAARRTAGHTASGDAAGIIPTDKEP